MTYASPAGLVGLHVTAIYWAAAAAAVTSAVQAAGELARDRLHALAAWALTMTALGTSLALAAAAPAVLQGQTAAATWACALSILGTWAFAEVLATTSGDGRRVADMMTVPLLAGASAALLLLGLHWAASHRPHDAAAAAIGTQLTLAVYYAPGLARIAALAHQRARSAPPSWARVAMQAVATSAATALVLTMARPAVLITGASGTHAGTLVITITGALLGIAAASATGALAAGPMVTLIAARCQPWLACRRLRPLWAAVREAAPDAALPVQKSAGAGIHGRLLRRVTEIREAEQALRPYWSQDVAARALAAAQAAALSPGLEQALIEATVIINAATACLRGEPPAPQPFPADQLHASTGDDLHSEVERLLLVSQAIRQFPDIHKPTAAPPSRE
jgi:hypothetical protein